MSKKTAKQKPSSISVGREIYQALVLKIEGWLPDGRPRKLTAHYDTEEIHLDGGEHFMIVYASSRMLEKKGDSN